MWAKPRLSAAAPSGNRIVAAPAPGVAPENALQGEPTSTGCPVLLHGLNAVCGTRGVEAAVGAEERGEQDLVCPDEQNQEVAHQIGSRSKAMIKDKPTAAPAKNNCCSLAEMPKPRSKDAIARKTSKIST